MKQSRRMSLTESVSNIAVGLLISMWAQMLFLPMLGVHASFQQNFSFALIMIAVSIARSYLLRRVFEALQIRRPLSPFMQAVLAERFRQIDQEGWSSEHDDAHDRGELGRASGSYIINAGSQSPLVPHEWPWASEWWKPQGYRRDLVRGVALGIAEGERFDRARQKRERRHSGRGAE
jgi:hypothetical protein